MLRGDANVRYQIRYPLMTGYESLGEVIEVARDVQDWLPGDRVLAFYGHSTYAVLDSREAVRAPRDVPDDQALPALLTCDVWKAIRRFTGQSNRDVLITGAGAIGLMAVWLLKQRTMRSTTISEPRIERRALASALGARLALPPGELETCSAVFAQGLECSGNARAFSQLQRMMDHGSEIVILADALDEPYVLERVFHERELRVVGSSDGEAYPVHAEWYFSQPPPDLEQLAKIFDLRIHVDELANCLVQLAHGQIAPIKILVDYRPLMSLSA